MANTIINGGASPYPKHVGPAAICSFSDGAQDAPLKSLKFNIEPSQDLHGYSYPWPAGGGKNLLLPKTVDSTQTVHEVTVSWDATAEEFTVSGTSDTSSAFLAWMSSSGQGETKLDLSSGIYYISGNLPTGMYAAVAYYNTGGSVITSNLLNGNGSFKTQQMLLTNYASLLRVQIGVSAGATVTAGKFKLMISKESPTAWSPYSNICPISGWSQVDGKQSGEDMTDYTPITIALGQTVYGGTVDALAGEGESKLAFGSKDLSTVTFTNGTNTKYATISVFSANVKGGNVGAGNPNYMCNMIGTYAYNTGDTVHWYAVNNSTQVRISLPKSLDVTGLTLQVTAELAEETTFSTTPVSVSSLLGQNNIWCNTGDTELDYYPAAASVVAVLNKSSKVYTSIPLNRIRYETYTVTPLMSLDLDSFRSESGLLVRNVLPTTKCKLEFETPMMDDAALEEVWSICKAGFNNLTERKLKLKYYDTLERKFRTGYFYLPDVPTPIRNINETAGIINFGQIRFAFIEY